jgi:Transposase IS66 family/Phage integrase family/IS66 C-terminal element
MRDHALLSFLYNSGARMQEALELCPKAIRFDSPSCVRLTGKGRKERICPLWPETVLLLKKLLERQPRAPDQRLFVNRYGEPLSASGVRFKLAAYVKAAGETTPTLRIKHVTPHSFRHATAVHLISAGVAVTVIRSWLGHESLDTTNHYARANLETKRKALERVSPPETARHPPSWKRETSLLAWLDTLSNNAKERQSETASILDPVTFLPIIATSRLSGILQVDGYAAYQALARDHGGSIQLAFCFAHARRKFVKVYKSTNSPFAREMIERIGAIYAIEAEIRGTSAQQRLEARQLKSRPLMDALKTRLTEVVGQFFSQSPLAEAINYTLNHWDGLTLFLTDGRVEVDSNTVERSMRPIALGRKNSLFAGSEGGAESWAILGSLVTTAKLNSLDPQTYLTDVLERIVSGRTRNHQLHELLAWNWKAARERAERTAA